VKRPILFAVTLSMLWLLAVAARGGWIAAGDIVLVPGFLILISAMLVLCIVTLWRAFAAWHQEQLSSLIIVLVALLAGALLPSRPAFVFWLQRDHFIQVAEKGLDVAGEATGHAEHSLPSTPFYRSSHVIPQPDGSAVIEFIISDFYLPLVYVSTDQPADAYDTCSAGGVVVQKVTSRWFVCRRDWN
jgi:hypothetical protein